MTTTDLWILAPLFILACGSLLVLLTGAIAPGRYGTALGVAIAAAAAGWALMSPPATAAPTLGLSFTPFARYFTILFSLTADAALLLSGRYNERHGIRSEVYPATILFATFALSILGAAANLLILFLALEAMTFGFYILVAMDLSRPASGEAGFKYLILGATAAAFTAFGIALIYAAAGTLEIGPTLALVTAGGSPLAIAGWGLLLVGIAFKLSLVPAHLWTPDVYEGAPVPVTAFLSTASKGAAVVFLLLVLRAAPDHAFLLMPLRVLSLASMVVGNLAALRQRSLTRMLAYSAIAQMGYVALALLAGGPDGYEAAAFYLTAYTLMNLAAFGAIAALAASGLGTGVDDCRGLGYRLPLRGAVLAVAMFALAGIPPTAGFIGKFFIFAAAIRSGEAAVAIPGIVTAIVSAYYYLRVVVNLYMRPAESSTNSPVEPTGAAEGFCLAVTSIALLVLGIYPAPLLDLLHRIVS